MTVSVRHEVGKGGGPFGLVCRVAMLLLVLSFGSCKPSAPAASYWANFSYERRGGFIIPKEDSVRLPLVEGYDYIVRSGHGYLYIRNIENVRMSIYDYNEDIHDIIIGNLVHNDRDYFTYRYVWSNNDSRWKVAITKLGGDPQVEGDCVGYDSSHVLVIEDGVQVAYGYNLLPVEGEVEVECSIYPPSGAQGSNA